MQRILMAPSGRVCYVIFHPLSGTCRPKSLSQPLPVIKSEKTAGRWLSELFQNLLFRSYRLPHLSLWSLDTDLHASSPSLSVLKTGLFHWTCTHSWYIWIWRHQLAWFLLPLSLWGIYFDLEVVFPSYCQWRYTLDHQSWTSGISLRPRDYMPICRSNYI